MGADAVEKIAYSSKERYESSDLIVEVRNNDASVSFVDGELDSYIYDSLASSFSLEGDDISLEREESLGLMSSFSNEYYG